MQNLILYKWVIQKSRTEITPTVASAWSDFGLKYWNRQARAQAPVGIKTGFAIKEGWIRSRCFRTAEPRQQPQIKNTNELASEQKG